MNKFCLPSVSPSSISDNDPRIFAFECVLLSAVMPVSPFCITPLLLGSAFLSHGFVCACFPSLALTLSLPMFLSCSISLACSAYLSVCRWHQDLAEYISGELRGFKELSER